MQAENTYILALDGDVDFKPDAVRLLLDRMKKNKKVGAACGRIHPTGSGQCWGPESTPWDPVISGQCWGHPVISGQCWGHPMISGQCWDNPMIFGQCWGPESTL